MRHSKLVLTMNVYTDARLIDSAGAIESIDLLRGSETGSGFVTSAVAPEGHSVSHSDTTERNPQSAETNEILRKIVVFPKNSSSRGGGIRTHGLYVPNVAL